MKKNLRILFLMMAAIMVVAACGKGEENASNAGEGKLKVMTTFYPMYEFTKQVAGDNAEVELLVPENQEAHGWEPTPKDIAKVQDSDLFIYNSTYMETFVESIEAAVDTKEITFVEASDGITLKEGTEEEEHEHAEGTEEEHNHEEEEHSEHEHSHEYDPHVWLSPALAIEEVKNITKSLIKADPDNEDSYTKNSDAYIAKLQALDTKFKDELSNVSKKEMITQHAAFAYLASEYGLEQVAIAGLSPEQEPSAQKLAELKDFATEHDIKVIYFEETASEKVAQTLASEVGAKTEVLSTLEVLSKEDREQGLDYISVMERNLETIVVSQN
ncbi:metal ABC transporter substrate-binding protein [Bacillus sp. B1-b2]|uniref:metal ABC transporter substrate-binding protein n=1 Tax=Bacillus sp. B1-b2 TaxID=2653201 RepID=UPI001261F0A0|nr:metal ABC transporter substrate-binding protein [Bacillus sp. B1-b2]KAB7666280.1 zinc ABC transporter substrate-binding protein [Bacillus sp. B1-b2]